MDASTIPTPAAPAAAPADFESLLAPVVDRAYGMALRLTGNRDDAQDLVQEAALLAFRGFHTFRPGTHFRAWFFRILVNCFYASRRRRRPEVSLAEASATFRLTGKSLDTKHHERSLSVYVMQAGIGVHLTRYSISFSFPRTRRPIWS